MNRIDGKIAVVTGGTQGLGAAIAWQFARSGASGIVICGRTKEKGEAVAAAITKETGVPAQFVACDLNSVADCRNVVAETDTRFGKIDILVNAGAITDRGDILNTDEALFDRMFAVNTRAPFFLMQEAIRRMIRDKVKGSIVNIGSASAMAGQPFISAYCASKGALETLTRNTAFAVMRNQIRVNQLNIGWMSSENERALQARESGDPDWEAKAAAKLPFGRLVDPAEVAQAVTFLASDDSGLMTGSIIHFDQSVWGAYAAGPPVPGSAMAV